MSSVRFAPVVQTVPPARQSTIRRSGSPPPPLRPRSDSDSSSASSGSSQHDTDSESGSDSDAPSPRTEAVRRVVARLQQQVQPLERSMPSGYVSLWRFHNTPQNLQSHAYQQHGSVSDERLRTAATDRESQGRHMFQSSSREESTAVSYSSSLPQFIEQSLQHGADQQLQRAVHGSQGAARRLAYTQVPRRETAAASTDFPLPRHDRQGRALGMRQRSSMLMARDRATRETETLHLPQPGTGGRTQPPLMVFDNPFPTQDELARPRSPRTVRSYQNQREQHVARRNELAAQSDARRGVNPSAPVHVRLQQDAQRRAASAAEPRAQPPAPQRPAGGQQARRDALASRSDARRNVDSRADVFTRLQQDTQRRQGNR